jgi:5-methylcytosine-specific restriction endonuclease McrA
MSAGSSRGAAWNALRLQVLDRDGWVCSYCARAIEGYDATVDHILAVNNGGTDDLGNLTSACRSCNGSKSDREIRRVAGFNSNWLSRL